MSDSIDPGPTEDQVLAAVRATGFLLEQEVAQVLVSDGFTATVSRAFQDPDEGKSREVDVYGYKEVFRDDEVRTSFGVEIIAECKNSTNPFIVIGRGSTAPSKRAERRWRVPEAAFWAGENMGYPVPDRPGSNYKGSPWRWLGLGDLPGALDSSDFVGSQLLRMQRVNGGWKADNNQIFDSVVLPMSKAMQAFQKPRRNSSGRAFDQHSWASGVVTFPLLVTPASIFRVDADEDPVRAEQVPWVSVGRDLQTKDFNGLFTMTVVNQGHLSDYINRQVLAFARGSAEILSRNPTALTVREQFELVVS